VAENQRGYCVCAWWA